MAEVQIVEQPMAQPAQCVYCGSPKNETRSWFLDTGLHYDGYGVVYICCECTNFLMDKMGYMSIDRANDLREANIRLARENKELEIKNLALQQAINAMKVAGFEDDQSDDNLTGSDSFSNPSELILSQIISKPVDTGQEELFDREAGSSESSNEPGLADISTDKSSNPFDFNY